MSEETTCAICNLQCPRQLVQYEPSVTFLVKCERCGTYQIESDASNAAEKTASPSQLPDYFCELLGPSGSRTRANLSAFIRERFDRLNSQAKLFRIPERFFTKRGQDDLGKLFFSLPEPSFHRKADLLLLALERETQFAGQELPVKTNLPVWVARAWAINEYELGEILEYLNNERRIVDGVRWEEPHFQEPRSPMFNWPARILPEGWAHLEKIKRSHLDSSQGFVAMWFIPKFNDLFTDTIAPALNNAGYTAFRVDRKDHVGKIDDEIAAEIKRSRFIVADFTGHRGGVYFEAGYAMGLGIPVIWTCRKNHMKKLHFDIRQYNCLDWEMDKLDDFKDRLRWRIENVCGRGKAVPPSGKPEAPAS